MQPFGPLLGHDVIAVTMGGVRNTALTASNLLFEMLCVLPGVEYSD